MSWRSEFARKTFKLTENGHWLAVEYIMAVFPVKHSRGHVIRVVMRDGTSFDIAEVPGGQDPHEVIRKWLADASED